MTQHRRERRWARFGLAAALVAGGLALAPAQPAAAVVGGTPVPWTQYPYMAKVNSSVHSCSATVIGTQWILTAAHCVWQATGVTTVSLSNGYSNVNAINTYVHPLYDGDYTDGHDVALVEVPYYATTAIAPIQLGSPFDRANYAPQEATIVGFGRTSRNADDGGTLRDVDTPLRSDDYMDDIYNPWYWFDNWIEHLMIGAGSTAQTACLGDSGGPLVVMAHYPHPVQVGVFSFILENCDAAAAFAEMNGPQLAWVASIVPEVVPSWGSNCATEWNTLGHPAAVYGTSPAYYDDGQYHWNIWCTGPPPPPPSPHPTPDPGPEDPPPPGCFRTCP